MQTAGGMALAPGVHLQQLSEMGGNDKHVFILGERQLLLVQQHGLHAEWVRLMQSWHQPLNLVMPSMPTGTEGLASQAMNWQGGSTGGYIHAVSGPGDPDVRTMSEWQKLLWAAWEGAKQFGPEVKAMIEELLNWSTFFMLLGVGGLMLIPGVGEMVLLFVVGSAIVDLLKNVTALFRLYYETAVGATSWTELRTAGKYFAQALLAGLLDVLAVYGSPAALAQLRALRVAGRLTLQGWSRFFAQQGKTLQRRLRSGGGTKLRPIDITPKSPALPPPPASKLPPPAPTTTKPPTSTGPTPPVKVPAPVEPPVVSPELPATLPPVKTPPTKPGQTPTLPGLPVPTVPPVPDEQPPAKMGGGDNSREVWDNRQAVMDAVEGGHLPGSRGAMVGDVPLTDEQMIALTEQYGIEFAQVYTPGKGPNGSGGQYTLYSGTVNRTEIPGGPDVILVSHTHPAGTPHPSVYDHRLMLELEKQGHPQKTSIILLPGKPPKRIIFDKDTPYMNEDGVLIDPKKTRK